MYLVLDIIGMFLVVFTVINAADISVTLDIILIWGGLALSALSTFMILVSIEGKEENEP